MNIDPIASLPALSLPRPPLVRRPAADRVAARGHSLPLPIAAMLRLVPSA